MKLSLYHIEQEYLQLAESIIDNFGELTPEQETALAINKDNLQVKAANYAYVVKDIEDDVSLIYKEIERLTELKKSRNKTIDKLKETLKTAMLLYGVDKIESNLIKLSFRSSQQVIIEDDALVDDKFKIIKTTTLVSKTHIKEAILKGETVVGAILQDNKSLQIK